MKSQIVAFAAVLAVSSALVGCDRTISRREKVDVKSDGTVKTTEKSVVEKSDGSVVKKEEVRRTSPNP